MKRTTSKDASMIGSPRLRAIRRTPMAGATPSVTLSRTNRPVASSHLQQSLADSIPEELDGG
jgi:hypothetical protein